MILLEVCVNDDCTEHGGGWVAARSTYKSDLHEYIDKKEPGECPVCGELLEYQICQEI